MIKTVTNFQLLGNRDYVHSSNIIEYLHKNCEMLTGFSTDGTLLDIKFYGRITTNCAVEPHDEPVDNSAKDILCEAVIRCDKGKRFIYFKEALDSKWPESVPVNYDVSEIELNGNYSGKYRIQSDTYGHFIKNLIEANKRVHLADCLDKDIQVINIFMRNVPLSLCLDDAMIQLDITNIGRRDSHDGSILTLNRISISELDTRDIEVGFSLVR